MGRHIHIHEGNLEFSSAHMVLLGSECESLHGHNFGVDVELEGELDEDSVLFDFRTLKQIIRELCKKLDHQVLLPQFCQAFTITESEKEYELYWQSQRYVFPQDCVTLLPIDNVTAERLAEYLAITLSNRLHSYVIDNLTTLTVGVSETAMQTAYYSLSLAQ